MRDYYSDDVVHVCMHKRSQPHAHTAAWNILVFGKKRWYIWPKVCYSLGYADGHGMSVWEWAVTRLPKLKGTPCAPFEFEQGSVTDLVTQ